MGAFYEHPDLCGLDAVCCYRDFDQPFQLDWHFFSNHHGAGEALVLWTFHVGQVSGSGQEKVVYDFFADGRNLFATLCAYAV